MPAFRLPLLIAFAVALAPGVCAQNLVRNSALQDDWITLLPENKTLHWAYGSDFYNRRDYNPDTWNCRGSWRWEAAAEPQGQRRFVLQAPEAQITQRINWVAVHDDRARAAFPDAGGFPALKPQRSPRPLRLVRDLTLRVRVKGSDVPPGAAGIDLALCPPGDLSNSDPMGTPVAATVTATAAVPEGTFDWRTIEVSLPASRWAQAAGSDPALPGTVRVDVRYKAASGSVEIGSVEVVEPGPDSPNLLAGGGFEALDPVGYPVGWGQAEKYRYFPPGYFYLFTTWHNTPFENRGPVDADGLVVREGASSLKMIVAAGDEKAVRSQPIALNQSEPRLIEVGAWVKTDRLASLQIDAVDELGARLDGFNFIHKAPVSIGTEDWRFVRQVFRPRRPVQSLRLLLCARGTNGYTLDDAGTQPQNNVVGTIWWDDVRVYEPESTAEELAARGAAAAATEPASPAPRLERFDPGERMFGENTLTATIANSGPAKAFALRLELVSPSGKRSRASSAPQNVPSGGRASVSLSYVLAEPCPGAYTEYRGSLALVDERGAALRTEPLWFGVWTAPIDLDLGALYLRPEQRQFVRMNLGLTARAMRKLDSIRLDVVRKSGGQTVATSQIAATPAAVAAQRERIPVELRDDFGNLLLADLDVSALPVQPFDDPQRNWFVRATALDTKGRTVARVESAAFCRQAGDPAQPAVERVRIDRDNLLYVNDRPWMPWGAIYGHVPTYAGPAESPSGVRDLRNLPTWSVYDRFSSATYTRAGFDFSSRRYVAASITPRPTLDQHWVSDNQYAAAVFPVPSPVFSVDELSAGAGGRPALDAYLAFCKTAPMVVSTAPGVEEVFGLFHSVSTDRLAGMRRAVELLRSATNKPVMVSHGGYWNRLEFERVPFFDIYDPETEPFYPANLHTDLQPLVRGREQAIWLRPQMYEDVPYERWRFHAFVELMRGCRGWEFAHGPGDASLFRGLHGEMEFVKPIAYSKDFGPQVRIEPAVEQWTRRHDGKVYVIAATTRGIAFGAWRWDDAERGPAGRARVTDVAYAPGDESNSFGIGGAVEGRYRIHGIQFLPAARVWPEGSRLVQWVRLDAQATPRNLGVLVKVDGRWTHSASWGGLDLGAERGDRQRAGSFLRSFYRYWPGFLGWDDALVDAALQYVPASSRAMGALPQAGGWVRLEVPLDEIGAAGGLVDGAGFLHEGGRAWWGRTSIVTPDGTETVLWGDSIEVPAAELAHTKVSVAGLKAGARVRVLFEDRELAASEGFFTDDLRGQDLYQRFGGASGYGSAPVALRIYEITP